MALYEGRGAEGEVCILRFPGIAASSISLLFMGGVCGRSLTAGKILFTESQTCSLYLVLWLCGHNHCKHALFYQWRNFASGSNDSVSRFSPKSWRKIGDRTQKARQLKLTAFRLKLLGIQSTDNISVVCCAIPVLLYLFHRCEKYNVVHIYNSL